MVRSLITQLLVRKDIDWNQGPDGFPLLSFLRHEDVQKMQKGSYRTYLKVLGTLLIRTKGCYDAIFVMIDGVEFFDRQWEEKMKKMTKCVKSSVNAFNADDEGASRVGTLKVLLTAASYSSCLASVGASMTVIDMPEDIERDGDGFKALR